MCSSFYQTTQNLIKDTEMEDLKIFDKDGKALHIADVISRFLSDKVDYRSDSDVMIGMRGMSKNIPCLYRITPIGYEPHRIEVVNDL